MSAGHPLPTPRSRAMLGEWQQLWGFAAYRDQGGSMFAFLLRWLCCQVFSSLPLTFPQFLNQACLYACKWEKKGACSHIKSNCMLISL